MAEVFPFPHNWREKYRARFGYLTNVLTAENDTEMRRCTRVIPSRSDAFQLTVPEQDGAAGAAETAWLDALLFAGQATQWALPRWPDATTLEEDVVAGSDVVLPCETADRGFRVGGFVVLHLDALTTALATATAVAADSVTVDELAADWPGWRTQVLPADLARWAQDLTIGRPTIESGELEVGFDYELGVLPGVALASTTPAVFSVLDPNRRETPSDTLSRSVVRHASPTADFADFVQGATPIGGRKEVLLTLDSRAQIAALVAWFHGVRGAYRAFWWPTWHADLVPIGEIAGDTLTIVWMGYTARLFEFEARRHLAFIPYAGDVQHRRVLAAVDNEDGTETLTLSSAPTGLISYVAFLLYVRGSDELELAYESPEVAEARLTMTELPRQVPEAV
jgi:hypothetical protein